METLRLGDCLCVFHFCRTGGKVIYDAISPYPSPTGSIFGPKSGATRTLEKSTSV
jgi:hypothetical protein